MYDYEATSRYVTTYAGRLHFHDAGAGDPLILLHGSGPGVDGWTNFAGNLPAFAKSFRVLILYMPGFCGGGPASVSRTRGDLRRSRVGRRRGGGRRCA